jgi:hypothetical protein
MLLKTIGAAALCWALAVGAAQAASVTYKAALKGADEVPANTTAGKGEVTAKLDTKSGALTYTVTYSGLTGPATMAHFHGPAAAGANAPPVVVVKSLASPMTGTATLTAAQMADLAAGKWYFNVHTAAHMGGEIRGQLAALK